MNKCRGYITECHWFLPNSVYTFLINFLFRICCSHFLCLCVLEWVFPTRLHKYRNTEFIIFTSSAAQKLSDSEWLFNPSPTLTQPQRQRPFNPCSVFHPVNRCFACLSLVYILTFFPSK